MEEIKLGHTNKKFRNNDEFIVYKTYTGYNHRIDYKQLAEFDFVPKLIHEDEEKVVWEYIEGEMLENPTDEDLENLGKIIRTLHKSDAKFPKNNLRKRVQGYLKIISEKGIKEPLIDDNYREMQTLLTNMGKLNPSHIDPWWQNILKDKNGKLWLVDWEYATMGDKHFDLAYLIRSYGLSNEKKEIFLNAYNSMDDYQTWFPDLLSKYTKFVYYITLCWALAQENEPFPLDNIKKEMMNL